MLLSDTIFALSSGMGKAGIAVIRVSGADVPKIARALRSADLPSARHATFCHFHDPATGDVIDRGLMLYFPGPSSFTGEDVLECHVHGGRAVLDRMFQVLHGLSARPADPGEFTRRAFEHDKFDLTAAEGIADLIEAETEGQRVQAFRQMEGSLGRLYEEWRATMLQALALLEAEIDFPDEELPEDLSDQVLPLLDQLIGAVTDHLADSHRGERLRDGVRVAIVGPPNVGKSSLLNALAQRDVAIVSDLSGTTRDIIDVHLDLGGVPVVLSDTAGLREKAGVIEAEGIARARKRAEESDIRIFVAEATAPEAAFHSRMIARQPQDLTIYNKSDLLDAGHTRRDDGLYLSAKQNVGLGALLEILTECVTARFGHLEKPSLTRARHRQHLKRALTALERCRDNPQREVSLRAEDVRSATQALGEITGRTSVEDMLDLIFSEFCIGK